MVHELACQRGFGGRVGLGLGRDRGSQRNPRTTTTTKTPLGLSPIPIRTDPGREKLRLVNQLQRASGGGWRDSGFGDQTNWSPGRVPDGGLSVFLSAVDSDDAAADDWMSDDG